MKSDDPLNKTDFGKLLIAKSYIKNLRFIIGQQESEIEYLKDCLKKCKKNTPKNIDELKNKKREILDWIE